jgi:hypothetical protein
MDIAKQCKLHFIQASEIMNNGILDIVNCCKYLGMPVMRRYASLYG